jgi:hypothetical protein
MLRAVPAMLHGHPGCWRLNRIFCLAIFQLRLGNCPPSPGLLPWRLHLGHLLDNTDAGGVLVTTKGTVSKTVISTG